MDGGLDSQNSCDIIAEEHFAASGRSGSQTNWCTWTYKHLGTGFTGARNIIEVKPIAEKVLRTETDL